MEGIYSFEESEQVVNRKGVGFLENVCQAGASGEERASKEKWVSVKQGQDNRISGTERETLHEEHRGRLEGTSMHKWV